jgi:hypothetical protein
MEESGLARARPDVVIEFARPRGYPELLEATFDDAAAYARDDGVSRADRKVIRSEAAAPLEERPRRG